MISLHILCFTNALVVFGDTKLLYIHFMTSNWDEANLNVWCMSEMGTYSRKSSDSIFVSSIAKGILWPILNCVGWRSNETELSSYIHICVSHFKSLCVIFCLLKNTFQMCLVWSVLHLKNTLYICNVLCGLALWWNCAIELHYTHLSRTFLKYLPVKMILLIVVESTMLIVYLYSIQCIVLSVLGGLADETELSSYITHICIVHF